LPVILLNSTNRSKQAQVFRPALFLGVPSMFDS
jgi:hypothetical protein